MKLAVENFGPIRKAEVDIKPMTVFVGPSNTGKSYLAMLIYSIVRVFERDEYRRLLHSLEIHEEFYEKEEVDEIIADDKRFDELVNELFLEFVKYFRILWEAEALRCFGEEWKNITAHKKDLPSVVISNDKNKISLDLLVQGKDEFPRIDSILIEIKEKISSSWNKYREQDIDSMSVLSTLVATQFSSLFHPMLYLPEFSVSHGYLRIKSRKNNVKTHYLPAVRGGLMQSHRILVSSLIDRAPTMGLTGAEIVPFTGVLADFLKKLLNIRSNGAGIVSRERQSQNTREVANLSKEIEQKIIHGKIKTKMLITSYPDFRYQFDDKNKVTHDISLINSSSSVSELAPIILFIRYYLSAGDVFIVEEPEAHLHPEAQRTIAGVLVELVNAGVHVVVTTHSDIILEQISNFIHADKVPQAKVLNKKAKGRTLSKDKSGLYGFKRAVSSNKTTVRPVKFDEETGMLTKDHLDVSSDLYNETVDLFNARERIAEKGKENDI